MYGERIRRALRRWLWREPQTSHGAPGADIVTRIVSLTTFVPEGCRFEISCPTERFRVEQYGDEEEFTTLILRDLATADVLYDIGSCLGLVSIHAAAKGCKVVAFEPDPGYRARLLRNIGLNSLSNIQVEDWAVSDTEGIAQFFTDGVDGYSGSLRKMGDRGSTTVRTGTIDHAVGLGQLPAPTVVKMDVEGAEMLALKGMTRLLASPMAPRSIFIEIHPEYLHAFGSSRDEVSLFFDSYRYQVTYERLSHNQVHRHYRRSTSLV